MFFCWMKMMKWRIVIKDSAIIIPAKCGCNGPTSFREDILELPIVAMFLSDQDELSFFPHIYDITDIIPAKVGSKCHNVVRSCREENIESKREM